MEMESQCPTPPSFTRRSDRRRATSHMHYNMDRGDVYVCPCTKRTSRILALPPIGDLETNPKKSQNQEALQVSPHPQLSLEANEDERGLGLVSSHRKQSIRHPEPIASIECVTSPSFRAPSCLSGPSSSRTTPTPPSSISTAKPSCSFTFSLAFSYFLSLVRHPPSHPSCRTWMTS